MARKDLYMYGEKKSVCLSTILFLLNTLSIKNFIPLRCLVYYQ